jgi:hydrogenase maturation protein HypF
LSVIGTDPVQTDTTTSRRALTICGVVQGVGMRPFIFRLAHQFGLSGLVQNGAGAVRVEIQGALGNLDAFAAALRSNPPPGAVVGNIDSVELPRLSHDEKFVIVPSRADGTRRSTIPPDLATCRQCSEEAAGFSASRRDGYAFTSCSFCGPRHSIIEALPYDRGNTTMRRFAMCGECAAEYCEPRDRRFHAQPIACPRCGPALELLRPKGERIVCGRETISIAAAALRRGEIIALKGMGGFQLLVDATDAAAVAELRRRKRRPDKPLALMVPDLTFARACCLVSEVDAELLAGAAAPIVLMRKRNGSTIADSVAPRNLHLGLMLPYSPLHSLLLAEAGRPLVCTSGNLSDEPICIDTNDALQRLTGIADLFLVHDRGIARPLDDSVVRTVAGRPQMLRRARGYTPKTIYVAIDGPVTLALGGHQKSVIGLAIGRDAILSQHLGDLDDYRTRESLLRAIDDLTGLFDTAPELLVCDLHPDYFSTAVAERMAESLRVPLVRVQHHHAHIAACVAESRIEGPVLGFAWDGTGYGTDGTLWGGETLLCDGPDAIRFAHLLPFPLVGGTAAIRDPRRAAFGLLLRGGISYPSIVRRWFDGAALGTLEKMVSRVVNSPSTSSIGRLFDAVAALSGVCERPTYDGQAAAELESIIGAAPESAGAYPVQVGADTPAIIDWRPTFRAVLDDLQASVDVATVSARFHNALVNAAVAIAERAAVAQVVLGGGCFQNTYLATRLESKLTAKGFRVFQPHEVPVNDGGLALGQILIARLQANGGGNVSRNTG